MARPATTTNPVALVIFGLVTAGFGIYLGTVATDPAAYLSTGMFAVIMGLAVVTEVLALLFVYCAYRFHAYNRAYAAYEKEFESVVGAPPPPRRPR
ncbi:MAG: hypothetical protein KBB39_05135 [Phycicoccus sp.]|nr:hypothetical protein [Phycicoccus sp.]